MSDRVKLFIISDNEYLISIITSYKEQIEKETLSEIIEFSDCIMEKQVNVDNNELILRINKI